MKTRYSLLPILMFLISFFTTADAMAGWHSWSQSTRNQAIVDETYQYNNTYVGESCKEWARTVLYGASNGAVTIPSTAAALYYWYSSSNVVGRSGLIEYAQPGEVVQMKLNSGIEHTAIVLAVSPSGVTFIESNWGGDEYVHVRYVTFTNFYNQVDQFTIYYIL